MSVRLRYTGLLTFTSGVLSLFTGLVFSSFVARGLSKFDYGVWTFISSTLVYFQFSQKLIPSWAFRDIARGKPVEKTCVISELLLSVPFFIAYIVAVPFFSQIIGSSPSFFYLSSIFIPVYFAIQGFSTVIGAKFPHRLAYREIILDSIKIGSILWLIQFGLYGFVVSVMIAHFGFVCYCFYVTKNFMQNEFDSKSLKRWLSLSWVNLYGQVGSTVSSGLNVLLLGILSSPSVLGSWGIALTVARLLKMSSSLPSALYSKLLSEEEKKAEYTKEAMMLTLMFLIPMTVGCYLLAPNLIEVYGSKYLDGLPALYILPLDYFIYVISLILSSVISAAEKIDLEKRLSASMLLRSDIFFLSSLSYLNAIISAPLMFLLIPKYGMVGCAIASVTTTTIIFLIKSSKFNILKLVSYGRLAKFLLASSIMGAFIHLVYGRGTVKTFLLIISGGIIYFSALLALDKETRKLTKKILNEIKSVIKEAYY